MAKNTIAIGKSYKVLFKRSGDSSKGHWTMLVVNSAGVGGKNDIIIWAGKFGDGIDENDHITIKKVNDVSFYFRPGDIIDGKQTFHPKCEMNAEVEKVMGIDELHRTDVPGDLGDLPSEWLENDGDLPY